jgi:hypothetical protein
MKRIALVLALLAATTACDGTTPTELSPSFENGLLGSSGGRTDDGGYMGSGGGMQSEDDGGLVGSGVGAQSVDDGGALGSGGGRTGLVGAIGG